MAGGSGKLLNEGPAFEAGSGKPAAAWGGVLLMRDCPLLLALGWRNLRG
jgi:hypothetical protein